ncbi:class I SAM-dependent methyltransferase [Roseobacter ponti]|uniref:Methyltransferase domain-containing protein n=1 Tax=Roseobacter ponti TaxID=1891787 RepID=A0A858SMY0_9RHOB|nr:methyltransferase domain-containing protein [Roseobacter ponti]QJF50199.1 methyltransferase domain-containing protein [Roseobacter ponti]
MAVSDTVFAGSIPDVYDEYLVPLIFEHYAQDMAQRVLAGGPAQILETAAGSGVVTRLLADGMPEDAHLLTTDLNQPMLDRNAARLPARPGLRFQQADALALPCDNASFDVVCCQFGVMFFPDRVKGYREALRVLKPGGTFVFNAWDAIAENLFAQAVTEKVSALFPEDPPVFMARTPHGYHDAAAIAADVRSAGFERCQLKTVAAESTASSARAVAVAFCQGTPLRNELEARDGMSLAEITDAVEAELITRFGIGVVRAPMQAHVVVAQKA